jgi:hypothetical protein
MVTSMVWSVSCPVAWPYCTRSAVWCHPVELHHHCSRVQVWSKEFAFHCSRLSAHYAGLNGDACPHVSLALLITAALVKTVCLGKTQACLKNT